MTMANKGTDYWALRAEGLSLVGGKRRAIEGCLEAFGAQGLHAKLRLLELGVGAGHFLEAARLALVSYGYEVEATGIDIDREALALSRNAYPDLHVVVQDATADSWDLPGSFDCIFAVNVLHEVYSSAAIQKASHAVASSLVRSVILHCHSLLDPGGYCFVFDGVEVADRESTVALEPRNALGRELALRFRSEYIPLDAGRHIVEIGAGFRMPAWVALRLLTKIKWMGTSTWQQEREETYQYFAEPEFLQMFRNTGFDEITTSLSISDHRWAQLYSVEPPDWTFDEHILIQGMRPDVPDSRP